MNVRFPKAGAFTYYCDIHPGMKGTVRVVGKRTPRAVGEGRCAARQAADRRGARGRQEAAGHAKPPANTINVGSAARAA